MNNINSKPIKLSNKLDNTGYLSETAQAELLDEVSDYLREVAVFLQGINDETTLPVWMVKQGHKLLDDPEG